MEIDIDQIKALDSSLSQMRKLLDTRLFLRNANVRIDMHARKNNVFKLPIDVGFESHITDIPASFVLPLIRGRLAQENVSNCEQCLNTVSVLTKQLQEFAQSLAMEEVAGKVTYGDDARA